MDKLLIKRGSKRALEQLDPLQVGELFLAKDEERLYIGGPRGNIPIATQKEVDEKYQEVATKLEQTTDELKRNANIIVYINDPRFGAVGDGITDDTQAIQRAIDYVYERGGGVVGVPPSEQPYIFTSIQVKTGVTLRGYGGVLKFKDAVCTNVNQDYYLLHNLDHDHVTYENLIVDGNQENNLYFKSADIITAVNEGTRVINCTLRNAPDSGIMFSGARNGRCQYNKITNCRDVGIYVNGDSDYSINGAIISDNIVNECVYGGIALKRKTVGVVVSNNTITNCGNGITVENFEELGMGHPSNSAIINNLLRDIGYMYRDKPNVAEHGISISKAFGMLVNNNQIYNCSGIGLRLGVMEDSQVNNNIVVSTDVGKQLDEAFGLFGANLTNVTIMNNTLKQFATRGMYIMATLGGQIINNTVETDGTGIRLESSCKETLIEGNIFHGRTLDTEFYSGHTCIIRNNILKSSPHGSQENMGILRVSASQPLPNSGSLRANYAGQLCVHLANNSWWIANSTEPGDWKQITN